MMKAGINEAKGFDRMLIDLIIWSIFRQRKNSSQTGAKAQIMMKIY